MPNWAEQVTAIATVVLAIGAVGAIGAAAFAGQQVREARIGRQAEVASDLFRRWSDGPMVEARRLVASYRTPEGLRDALVRHVAANDTEAYVLFREPDYFEQLGALEEHGAVDFELIRAVLGRRLVDRWELWTPAIEAVGGPSVYPMFATLAAKDGARDRDRLDQEAENVGGRAGVADDLLARTERRAPARPRCRASQS